MIRRAVLVGALRFALAWALYAVSVATFRSVPAFRVAGSRAATPPLAWLVLTTVGVAAALWWARDLVDRLATRIAFGRQAGSVAVVEGLLQRMSATLPVEEVLPRLAAALGRDRPRAQVHLWLSDGGEQTEVWPPDAVRTGTSVAVDVVHAGTGVGRLEVDVEDGDVTPVDRRVLAELVGPAGLALSTVRLTVELRHREAQLLEVNRRLVESTQRIRDARLAQQRQVRSELADRVAPHLDSVVAACTAQPPDLASAKVSAQAALDGLRRLARGVHPPRLAEDGLAPSLQAWAERSGSTAAVSCTATFAPPERAVVACAYFVAATLLEALVGAERPTVTVSRSTGAPVDATVELALAVAGPWPPALDEALTRVRDRVEAFDGDVVALGTPDGVRVVCTLPTGPAVAVGGAAAEVGAP